jgi:hypothetical protein
MTDIKQYSPKDGGEQTVALYRGLIDISPHVFNVHGSVHLGNVYIVLKVQQDAH